MSENGESADPEKFFEKDEDKEHREKQRRDQKVAKEIRRILWGTLLMSTVGSLVFVEYFSLPYTILAVAVLNLLVIASPLVMLVNLEKWGRFQKIYWMAIGDKEMLAYNKRFKLTTLGKFLPLPALITALMFAVATTILADFFGLGSAFYLVLEELAGEYASDNSESNLQQVFDILMPILYSAALLGLLPPLMQWTSLSYTILLEELSGTRYLNSEEISRNNRSW